jgi:CDGSH-type Zn-finger protein
MMTTSNISGGIQDIEEKIVPPTLITVSGKGPITIKGNVVIQMKSVDTSDSKVILDSPAGEGKPIVLCGCGASSNKPFCDNSHKQSTFWD